MEKTEVEQSLALQSSLPQTALFTLLRRRCNEYTGGQVSALPAETVARLMRSALFSVQLGVEGAALPENADALEQMWQQGQKKLMVRVRSLKLLCSRVQATLPLTTSRACAETLASIKIALKRMDMRYFSCEGEASIDYQLCVPITENLPAPVYYGAYLEQLLAENRFLNRFSFSCVLARLNDFDSNWQQELSNLCRPVAESAICRSLLKLPLEPVCLTDKELDTLADSLAPLGKKQRENALVSAAEAVCRSFAKRDGKTVEMLRQTAIELAVRLDPALKAGSLKSAFCAGS